ncbi:nitroreductase family protein [Actinoplanes palleronii]|uniref:Nitroreductase n=1 Tax=Actinoplanes palleronii TaxID=113570 RepID=A0ABQ4BNQ8_9ACTN|nr:nitroreductase family protein [Actinoplanes palleronii]GIE72285.1 nitroreductase [Actinoplanes palleronii]
MANDGVPDLHPLLRGRSSPTGFDRRHAVTPEEVTSLIEAARWAPSAGNSQPWSFLVALRGDATHERLVRHLARSSARWAPDAGALVVNLAHRYVAGTDWEYSEFALYDLGQAVAHLTVQAAALDLQVRQFRAFSLEGVVEEFGIPDHWQVTSMTAIGRATASGGTEAPARERRSVTDLLWPPSGE